MINGVADASNLLKVDISPSQKFGFICFDETPALRLLRRHEF